MIKLHIQTNMDKQLLIKRVSSFYPKIFLTFLSLIYLGPHKNFLLVVPSETRT